MSIAPTLAPAAVLICFAWTVQLFVFPPTQAPASWLICVADLIIQL